MVAAKLLSKEAHANPFQLYVLPVEYRIQNYQQKLLALFFIHTPELFL